MRTACLPVAAGIAELQALAQRTAERIGRESEIARARE
jgi:hypothetical protein